jgi:hypothetical protein
VRFLGGVWIGVGLLLMLSPLDLERCRAALTLVFGLIFLGGLARLGQMNLAVTLGPDIVGSLVAEVIGMPVLYVWLTRALRDGGRYLPRAAVVSSSRAT